MKGRVVLLLSVVLLGIGTGYLTNNSFANLSNQERATVVQEGAMTALQKEHSKLYKKYNSDRKIPDLARKEKGDVEVYRLSPLGADLSSGPAPTTSDILMRATCNAEAVVLGVVRRKSSQLTEDESFVFTDYDIAVEQVLKDNRSYSINTISEITITRPGGTIALNGKEVRAIDESFRTLQVGQRYLLFLQFLPTTGTYRPIDSGESFELRGNTVKSLKEESFDRFADEQNSTSVIEEIRVAAANPCNDRKGGGR
jgi:hypothetical protein